MAGIFFGVNPMSLSQHAVLVALNISVFSGRKFDRTATEKVSEDFNASNEAGRYNKLIVPKSLLAEVNHIAGQARSLHYELTVPWMHNGVGILSSKVFNRYSTELGILQAKFQKAVAKIVRVYPDAIESAKNILGLLFNASDYPDASQLERLFSFDWTIMPVPEHGDFRVEISDQEKKAMERALSASLKKAQDGAMRELASRMHSAVKRMADTLKSYNDGAISKFTRSLVDDVRDMCVLLPQMNVSGDKSFDSLCADVSRSLSAHDPVALRNDPVLSIEVQKKAEQLVKSINNFM